MDQQQMMLEYLLGLGELQPQQDEMAHQRERVGQLRGMGAMPGMRQAGRVSVAANPLEFLGAVGAQGAATLGDKDLMAQQAKYGGDRRALLAGLRNKMMPGMPGAQPMDQADYGGGV
jgi:hypothetical protein